MKLKSYLKQGSISTGILISIIILINIIIDRQSSSKFLLSLPLISSIIICSFCTHIFIPKLNLLKVKQIIRLEGPKAHYKKAGTATMGGLVIVPIALLIGNLLSIYNSYNWKILAISLITLGFMFIGALDDWRSLSEKTNNGLSPNAKIFLQASASTIFLIYTYSNNWLDSKINLPMGFQLYVGIFIIPISIFVFLAESNSTNLTDGLDGLASGCGALVFSGMAIELMLRGDNESYLMSVLCNAMAGSWLGFLIHNKNPARIFMGDTGSLAMGGALTSIALMTNSLWSLFIMGGIFVLESLSVIFQVSIFKLTKKYQGTGKRLFLMTPLHHHYEIAGVNENIIVVSFWIISGCFVGVGLLLSPT